MTQCSITYECMEKGLVWIRYMTKYSCSSLVMTNLMMLDYNKLYSRWSGNGKDMYSRLQSSYDGLVMTRL